MISEIQIGAATAAERPVIDSLLRTAGLPIPAEGDPPVEFCVARWNGAVIGVTGWEIHGDFALLRSVAVAQAVRRHRVAQRLIHHALGQLSARGITDITLVTLTAARFFTRFGFETIERDQVPLPVQASPEYRFLHSCCSHGTWMRRTVRLHPAAAPTSPQT